MTEQCCATNNQVMIMACSGGSNVGQLSNRVAVELTREGRGKMFCLVGIGAGLSGFVRSACDVPHMVLIDGCEVGCGKKALEREGIPLQDYLVITEMGLAKNKDFQLKAEDIARVKGEVCRICGTKEKTQIQGPLKSSANACCG
ncbi:MAG: putative zinc-binding protein [Desulfohalobiaceae bacterium]|nr:putative zinc-binding protein [Desulfohalobiaceae bacterium]